MNINKHPWSLFSDFWEWLSPKDDELWYSTGRINEIWQSGYADVERRPYCTQRWPENWVEIHTDDAAKRGIESGDQVIPSGLPGTRTLSSVSRATTSSLVA